MQEKDINKLFREYNNVLKKAHKLDKYCFREFPEEVRNSIEDINKQVDDILASYPDNIRALHLKLNILRNYQDKAHIKMIAQKVLKIIDNELILAPENFNLYCEKIQILEELNRYNQAKKIARKVIKLCEQKLKFDKNNIEILKIQLQMYDKLLEMYTRRDTNEKVLLYIRKRSILKKILKINPSDKLEYELDLINCELKEYYIAYGIIIVLILFLVIAYHRY